MLSCAPDTKYEASQILSNRQLLTFSHEIHNGIILLPPNTTQHTDIKGQPQSQMSVRPQLYTLLDREIDLHKALPKLL